MTDWKGGEPQPSVATNEYAFNHGATMALSQPMAPTICINKADGTAMVLIKANGQIEFGPSYTPDAAAQAFWDCLAVYGNSLHSQLTAKDALLREWMSCSCRPSELHRRTAASLKNSPP